MFCIRVHYGINKIIGGITIKTLNYICLTLAIIGALNWGLIGLFNFDLVKMIFGFSTLLLRLIFCLVGLSGIYCLALYGRFDNRTHEENR